MRTPGTGARLALSALIGRAPSSRLDLARIEDGLRRIGVGEDLVEALVELGYFDAAGLTLCARMIATGLTPWRMTAQDYQAALAAAETEGITLPLDDAPPPPTPWDPALSGLFAVERRVVHEERLLDDL